LHSNSVNETPLRVDWKLTVNPVPIESGGPFSAALDGEAVFSESFLDDAQTVFEGGVTEVNFVGLNATVQVRSGATGPDVTLTLDPDEYGYTCRETKTECDPENDLPSIPGQRGNPDCPPENNLNPCGRFVALPTSTDCAPGGACDARNKTSQCSDNRFCIIGDLSLQLKRDLGQYTASSEEEVLFGWADESTGWPLDRMPSATEPIGPLGFRIVVGIVLVALECVMPDSTSDEDLLSFPIDMP